MTTTYKSPYTEDECKKCERLKEEVSLLQTELKKWKSLSQPLTSRGV